MEAIENAECEHKYYGSCDGFGPLWTCSECTGVLGCADGTFTDAWASKNLDAEQAAARVGDFLMRRIEMAVVAGWGCCDNPDDLAGFVKRSLWLDLPGNPWRDEAAAQAALSHTPCAQ